MRTKAWLAEAADHFERRLAVKSGFAETHYILGVVRAMEGRPEDAILCYEDTLRLDPNHARALTHTAIAFSNAGRHAEALPYFERAIQCDALLQQTHVNLAITYLKMGRPADALVVLREALRMAPEDVHMLDLARTAAEVTGQGAQH